MRILVVADSESEYIWDHFDETRFEGVDLVISCGDLKSEYLSFLATMIKAPLFYVHGNHDHHYRESPPEGCDSIEDKLVVYKNIRIVGLGGAIKYNCHPIHSVPPYQYSERQMSRRIWRLKRKLRIHNGCDILVTHAPIFGINDGKDVCHTGFKCFQSFVETYKPKYMIHGHMHLQYGKAPRLVKHGETQLVDAFGYYFINL